MNRLVRIAILLGPTLGYAQEPKAPEPQEAVEIKPEGNPPSEAPKAIPENPPAPPKAGAQEAAPATQPAEVGQWVYTRQYGWVWIPYGDEYVYTPAGEIGDPYQYVFYPAYGWTWVIAPWVWGIGPLPYFGVVGPWHYHWFRGPLYHAQGGGRPLFHGGYHGHVGGVHGSGHVGGHR